MLRKDTVKRSLSTDHVGLLFLVIAVQCVATTARGGTAFVGAVGTDSSHRYLQVARISDVASSPSVVQAEYDVSAQFDSVQDIAFLTSGAGGTRRIAVLGDCRDYVPAEYYDWYRWRGYTHQLQGEIAIYEVSATGDLSIVPSSVTTFDHAFQPWSASTVAWVDRGYQHGETWRLAGLSGGGLAVEASAVRDPGPGWQPDRDHPYNHLLVYDKANTLRFEDDVQANWSDGQIFDVAGLADPAGDHVVSTWAGVAGGLGNMFRWSVDWSGNQLVQESSTVGASEWCYYYSRIAPLAHVDGHVVSHGAVIHSNGLAAVNVSANSNTAGIDAADGWGRYAPNGILDCLGVCSDSGDGNVYVMLRRTAGNYELYSVAPTDGAYAYKDFTFSWTGSTSTIVASDGDAMASVPKINIPGDANGNGVVDATDAAALAAHWGQSGGWSDGDFNGDGVVSAADASILAANWGGTSEAGTVPEPGVIVMLVALGGFVVSRRRRERASDRPRVST